MASFQEIEAVLLDAKMMEQSAEDNCEEILKYLAANGLHGQISHIKNDEHHHQEVVDELLRILKS
jgi:hypothetical protein